MLSHPFVVKWIILFNIIAAFSAFGAISAAGDHIVFVPFMAAGVAFINSLDWRRPIDAWRHFTSGTIMSFALFCSAVSAVFVPVFQISLAIQAYKFVIIH